MLLRLAAALIAASAAAFAPRTGLCRRASARNAVRMSLSVPDQVSVFGRLAETRCVAEAGDALTAAKPKWIPAYAARDDHVPVWRTALFGDRSEIDYEIYENALAAMPFTAPLAAPPSEAAREFSRLGALAFWELLGGGDGALGLDAVAGRLLELSAENDGLHWSEYVESLTEMSETRSTEWTEAASLSFSANDDWEDSLADSGSSQLLADIGAGGAPPPPPPPDDGRTAGGLYLG